jgi:hypothetical protein
MSGWRLPSGGRFIARGQTLDFAFNGRPLQGLQGDTLASALLANGQMLLSRSFKYHRPRGLLGAGWEEPNAFLGLSAPRDEPNVLATTEPLVQGLHAHSQQGQKDTDVVVAMYHDQGLIPVKFLGLEEGVNQTLGLPFVRTSPDHGTAFDIAGKGLADPSSLLAALKVAKGQRL